MNYEVENQPGISRKAILYTILFHALLLAISVITEIRNTINEKNHFVQIDFTIAESIIPEEKESEQIPPPEFIDEKEIIEPEIVKNASPAFIKEPVINETKEAEYVIEDKINSLLDSVLLANPSVYGLKRVIKERMTRSAEESKKFPAMIEVAREKLKTQLVALYKDRYGDISPDKYAAQLHQKENTLSIPIPLAPIIDLLKELF